MPQGNDVAICVFQLCRFGVQKVRSSAVKDLCMREPSFFNAYIGARAIKHGSHELNLNMSKRIIGRMRSETLLPISSQKDVGLFSINF